MLKEYEYGYLMLNHGAEVILGTVDEKAKATKEQDVKNANSVGSLSNGFNTLWFIRPKREN